MDGRGFGETADDDGSGTALVRNSHESSAIGALLTLLPGSRGEEVFPRVVKADAEKWRPIIKAAGIKAE
jgi:hypothetical protein